MKNIKPFKDYQKIEENLLGDLQRLNPRRLENDKKALELIEDIELDFLENGEDLRKVNIIDNSIGKEIDFHNIRIGKDYTLSYVFGKYHPIVRNIHSGNREAGDRRVKITAIPFTLILNKNSLEKFFRARRVELGTVRVEDVETKHNYARNPNIGNHALYIEKEDKYKISGDVANTLLNFFLKRYNKKYPDLKKSTYKGPMNIDRIEKGLKPTMKYISATTKDGKNISVEFKKGADERLLKKMISNMTEEEYDKYWRKKREEEYLPIEKKGKEEKLEMEKKIDKIFKEYGINLESSKWEKYGFSLIYIPGYEFTIQFRYEGEDLSDRIKEMLKKDIDGYKGELVRTDYGLSKNDKARYYTIKYEK